MKILALEFSSLRRSVAVIDTGLPEPGTGWGSAEETGARGTHAFRMIEEALHKGGLEREAIECLVVGTGPGSYNGVRLAMALAQGWQLARGTAILGISTTDCLAAQARQAGLRGRLNVVIDAQRDEFYLATYEIDQERANVLDLLRLTPIADVQAKIDAAELVVGPEVDRWFPGARVLFPSATTLAQLAAGRRDFIPGERLEPIYLRETAFIKAPAPRVIPAV